MTESFKDHIMSQPQKTPMFKPADCQFGLTDNFESCFTDAVVGVLLSVPDGKFARDDIDEDDIKDFPSWLRDRLESECFYSAPDGWTIEQTKLELEKIGFIHNPNWDVDYGA